MSAAVGGSILDEPATNRANAKQTIDCRADKESGIKKSSTVGKVFVRAATRESKEIPVYTEPDMIVEVPTRATPGASKEKLALVRTCTDGDVLTPTKFKANTGNPVNVLRVAEGNIPARVEPCENNKTPGVSRSRAIGTDLERAHLSINSNESNHANN